MDTSRRNPDLYDLKSSVEQLAHVLDKIRKSSVSQWFEGTYHRELHERTRAAVTMAVLKKTEHELILSSFSLQTLVEVVFLCRRDWGGPESLEFRHLLRHRSVEQWEELCALDRYVSGYLVTTLRHIGPGMTFWSDYYQLSALTRIESRAHQIEEDTAEELDRIHPRVACLLNHVLGQKDNLLLREEPLCLPLPLWMLRYTGFPDRLVRLVHYCCRVGRNRDNFLVWGLLKDEAIKLLRTLVSENSTRRDRAILTDILGGYTVDELAEIPYSDRENEVDWSGNLKHAKEVLPCPLDIWFAYGGDGKLTPERKREIRNTLLVEYEARRRYSMKEYPELYPAFHAHLVEQRDNDRYPFFPLSLYDDYDNEDWDFDEERQRLLSPPARDAVVSSKLSHEYTRTDAERKYTDLGLLWQTGLHWHD